MSRIVLYCNGMKIVSPDAQVSIHTESVPGCEITTVRGIPRVSGGKELRYVITCRSMEVKKPKGLWARIIGALIGHGY